MDVVPWHGADQKRLVLVSIRGGNVGGGVGGGSCEDQGEGHLKILWLRCRRWTSSIQSRGFIKILIRLVRGQGTWVG